MFEKPSSMISLIISSPSVWRLLFQQVEKASMGRSLGSGFQITISKGGRWNGFCGTRPDGYEISALCRLIPWRFLGG
jgi:hypothetical protein